MNLTLERAKEINKTHVTEESLVIHSLNVCYAMGAMAKHFGEDIDHWEGVGYLHDFDYQEFPEEHLQHTEKELLAEGVSLDLRADFRQAKGGDATGALTEVTTGGHGARDYRGSELQLHSRSFSGMWDGGNLVCDGRYSYLLSPTVQAYAADPKYGIHTYPFTLTARDAEGKTVWTTTVTRAILDSPTDLRDASWGFDADGTYLYLTDGGRTALFDIRQARTSPR